MIQSIFYLKREKIEIIKVAKPIAQKPEEKNVSSFLK